MASIVDSFREVFSDRLSFFKLLLLTIPAYYCYQLFQQTKVDFSGFWFLTYVTSFFIFGFLIEVTNNVISENDSILPSMNPFKMALDGFKGLIAVGPAALICSLLANYVCSLINIIFWIDIALKSIVWLVVASVVVTSFLLFCAKKRILDAFNFPVLYLRAGDIIVVILFFILQLVIINIPTCAFLGYTLLVLFGFGPVFNFFVAYAIIFNLAVTGHYMGQAHYEAIAFLANKDNR